MLLYGLQGSAFVSCLVSAPREFPQPLNAVRRGGADRRNLQPGLPSLNTPYVAYGTYTRKVFGSLICLLPFGSVGCILKIEKPEGNIPFGLADCADYVERRLD